MRIRTALAFIGILWASWWAGLTTAVAASAEIQPPYSWRGIAGSGVFPARDLVTSFHDLGLGIVASAKDSQGRERQVSLPGAPGSRKNIVWRATLPHHGQNTPLVVRDRVFVLCDEGWKDDAPVLVCLDVKDGRILCQQPVDHLDAWPEAKAGEGRRMCTLFHHALWRGFIQH